MNEELKPVRCGCGGEAYAEEVHFWGRCYTVQCSECGIETEPQNTEAEAIQAWNTAMGGVVTYPCTTEDGVYTSGCTITNTSSPNENFHPVRDCMVGKERTAKVTDTWKIAGFEELNAWCPECEHRITRGCSYCPTCGVRLEWE